MEFLVIHDATSCMRACLIVLCIGAFISNLEFFCVLPAFRTAGPYSWQVIATEQVGRLGIAGSRCLIGLPAGPAAIGALLTVRGFCLAALPFVPFQTAECAIITSLLTATTLAFNFRRYVGDDGSDQMSSITIVVVWLCAGLGRTDFVLSLGLYFIAFQACTSYCAAGIAKALSREWRDGTALFKIFNTEAYGITAVAKFLHQRRSLGWVACWTVIIAESTFPAILFMPTPIMLGMLFAGVLFHLSCAIIMGLNSFLWAFAATYPAVIHVNRTLGDLF